MSQLTELIRKRAIDNLVVGRVAALNENNPLMVSVRMPNGETLQLPLAELVPLSLDDTVAIVYPSGDKKRAYVDGLAAVIVGGDPFNRIVGAGQG
jgi:hypothetical protein